MKDLLLQMASTTDLLIFGIDSRKNNNRATRNTI